MARAPRSRNGRPGSNGRPARGGAAHRCGCLGSRRRPRACVPLRGAHGGLYQRDRNKSRTRLARQPLSGWANPILWTRYFGPDTLGPILWTRYFGPDTLGPILWARYFGKVEVERP